MDNHPSLEGENPIRSNGRERQRGERLEILEENGNSREIWRARGGDIKAAQLHSLTFIYWINSCRFYARHEAAEGGLG